MPLVTVWPMPNGLPIASTRSPTSSASESPIGSAGRPSALDVEQREVGRPGRAPITRALELAPVGRHDHDLVGVLDHVVVGDDQAVGARRSRPSRASSPAGAAARAGRTPRRRSGRTGRRRTGSSGAAARCLAGVDVDHRRRRLRAPPARRTARSASRERGTVLGRARARRRASASDAGERQQRQPGAAPGDPRRERPHCAAGAAPGRAGLRPPPASASSSSSRVRRRPGILSLG